MQGKIIAFEGIDGCGKNTQSRLLYNYFKEKGKLCSFIEFPGYDKTFFGKEVKNYLSGRFGSMDSVNPKFSALLYALDRYEKKDFIANQLEKGEYVISDRYVFSNIAYQCAKIQDNDESKKLGRWIEHVEYSILKMPMPDLVVFIDMPPDMAIKLIKNRKQKAGVSQKPDMHEKDVDYLKKVYKIFIDLSRQKNWITVSCFNEKGIRDIRDISKEIIEKIKNLVGTDNADYTKNCKKGK